MAADPSPPTLDLAQIRTRIQAHRPALAALRAEPAMLAAVALVFHQPAGGDPELLFIERAHKEGDPWSGQMAFPGGRRDPSDLDIAATAARETFEEVGVELGSPFGRLDDFSGNRNARAIQLIVSPFVYEARERPRLQPNAEVQSTVWIPVPWILHPDSAYDYQFERPEYAGTFPAIRYDRYTVWGLTYRILGNLFSALGRELRPGE